MVINGIGIIFGSYAKMCAGMCVSPNDIDVLVSKDTFINTKGEDISSYIKKVGKYRNLPIEICMWDDDYIYTKLLESNYMSINRDIGVYMVNKSGIGYMSMLMGIYSTKHKLDNHYYGVI